MDADNAALPCGVEVRPHLALGDERVHVWRGAVAFACECVDVFVAPTFQQQDDDVFAAGRLAALVAEGMGMLGGDALGGGFIKITQRGGLAAVVEGLQGNECAV